MNWQDIREHALRVAGLFRRAQAEADMADEIEFHLAMRRRKYEPQESAAEAAAHARRDLGSTEKWKEAVRDVRRARPIEDFIRDLALAVRMLRKAPAFTAVALITLALAIGANTAIFSFLNALILRPLPVPHADELAILRIQPDQFGYVFNYPLFKYVERHSGRVFSHVFAFTGRNLQVHGANGTDRISASLVSGQYFAALGVRPEIGRYIAPADDRPGTPDGAVAVLTHSFWQSRFGGDRAALGKKIVLADVAFTVIGVMPSHFRPADTSERADIFIPFETEPLIDVPYNNIAAGYHNWWFQLMVRRRPGFSLRQANAFLHATSHAAMETAIPDAKARFDQHSHEELYVIAEPGAAGYSFLRVRFRQPLSVLMLMVLLVLLVACLNLATLLMARATAREREMATRFALGAGRGRLLRQLLTESMLLAVAGTALGLAASPLLSRVLLAFLSSPQNITQAPPDVSLDTRVFAFTALLAAVVTILTGMAPALRSTGRELQQRMREAGASLRGGERRHLWPRLLLACEVALALVLVTGAGLLGYSLVRLRNVPMGFEPHGLTLLQLEMDKQPRDGAALVRAYHDVADSLSGLPGAKDVSYTNCVPLSFSWWTDNVWVPGTAKREFYRNQAAPNYFRAMHTPLIAGREFRWTDVDGAPRVAILSSAAARQLFGSNSPLGHTINVDNEKTPAQVVGVVADTTYTKLRDAAPPTVWTPISQGVKNRPSFTAVMRVEGPPAAAIAAARGVVRRILPEIPPVVAMTMEQTVDESIGTERMMATLGLFFAGVALLITGIGLYGALAYATERRTGEIGIRMALGAQRRDVLSMVCRENALIALTGCAAGLVLSLGASRLVASFLYGVSSRSPAVLAVAALVLAVIAAAASLVPALRASQIDPIAAIRYE